MREYISNVLSVLAIVAMIPGCFSKQNKISKAALPQKQAAFSFDSLETNIDIAAGMADQSNYNHEIEAKLLDIPTMVGSVPVEFDKASAHSADAKAMADMGEDSKREFILSSVEGSRTMQAFVCQYDQEMVSNFYHFEMENNGWKRIACVKGYETTLVFQKPKRLCIISVRSLSRKSKNNYSTVVHICTSNKE